MRYGSVCSGIEAASAAWHPLGWTAKWFSEIEPFPCSVLKHHYPDVPNLGDMTQWRNWPDAPIDVLVGGTPCQSFSVAGLRGGLSDPRGGLMLQFLAIADRYKPRWVVWENVPGVLSSNGGRDFGTFLGALGELGYGWAYRVLDAQWFGVAQRRRRVFVVGCLGDQRSAAAVLFESESVRRDTPPSRETGEGIAGTAGDGTTASGEPIVLMDQGGSVMGTLTDGTVGTLRRKTHGHEPVVAFKEKAGMEFPSPNEKGEVSPALQSQNQMAVAFAQNQLGEVRTGEVANTINTNSNASGRNTPMVALAVRTANTSANGHGISDGLAHTLDQAQGQAVAIGTDCYNGAVTGDVAATIGTPGSSVNASGPTVAVMRESGQGYWVKDSVAGTLRAEGENRPSRPSNVISQSMQVRRLTPEECEALQGFPRGYTQVPYRNKPAADGPRYKALGNSMAVPCMRWIGERIQMVEDLIHD